MSLNEYRAHRQLLLERFGDTTDGIIARNTATASLLWPGSAEETRLAAALAQRALDKSEPGEARAFADWTVALAEYRQDKFDVADRRLAIILSDNIKNRSLVFRARVLQGMARLQANPGDQACAALDQAIRDYLRLQVGVTEIDWSEGPLDMRFFSEAAAMVAKATKKK